MLRMLRNPSSRPGLLAFVSSLALGLPLAAQDRPASPDFDVDWFVIDPVGRSGRAAVHTDAIEAAIVNGAWRAPKAGDEVRRGDGTALAWREAELRDGRVRTRRGGYAFGLVESAADRVVLLTARGHGAVYVNGELRAGNPYGTGWYGVPVPLTEGRNEFLFHLSRGSVEPRLAPVEKPVFFSGQDHTLPDLIVGEPTRSFLGIVVVNARAEPLTDAVITIEGDGIARDGDAQLGVRVPDVPAFGVYKVCVPCVGPAPREAGEARIALELSRPGDGGGLQDALELTLAVRQPLEQHRRVYRSTVDGSAQYYAVNPPIGPTAADPDKALFLSLHGAGVEAIGQARAYSQKSWGYLAAATNRRPYGFDWEDWGRIDAIDVLDDALARYPIDRSRVYLTGHSMGGHGTWQVGAHFPDRFAAIGPSAGWISFASYTRRRGPAAETEPDAIERLLARAASPSDTLALAQNYAQSGIYIVHGADDRNVPVREARAMVEKLGEFHEDFRIHEQPGAGHWWDGDPEPGAACVDFRPMFDFFARRRLPAADEVREVDFTTVDPGISATCHWLRIVQQQQRRAPSRVEIRLDPIRRGLTGETENVARFDLDPPGIPAGETVTFEIDGQELECVAAEGQGFALTRGDGGWRVAAAPPSLGQPPRGPFKNAFRNDFLCVVGTRGSASENAWARAKARYDAESFWYRGNGSVEILADADYDARRYGGRNVVLYGNASTNAAWQRLLGASPVQVDRASVRIGEKVIEGDDLACLFVRPHPDDDGALIGVVAGTGIRGLRLTERLPYFVSGVHYPDVFVAGADMLETGTGGVRAAGFFGDDWGVGSGEFAWR